jgi:hypothetical protein
VTWNLALYAFASVFILAAFLSGAGIVARSIRNSQPIETYLLAGGSLKRVSIVSLLLSASFGLSSLFYQVWLGFTVGAWGLIV